MKRALCAVLCCLLVLAVFPRLPAAADDDYLLCVVESTLNEDVSEAGRAAYIGGTIYVPYHALDSLYGIKPYYNERLQQLFVYSLDLRMTFDLPNGQTYDTNGEFYPLLAVRRAGTIFIPIQLVCDRFSLYFSFTPAGRYIPAPVIRICASRPALSDTALYARSLSLMQEIYNRYLAAVSPATPGSGTGNSGGTANPGTAPQPLLTYLMFEGALGETTVSLLDTLDESGDPAAFFLPAENAGAEESLLRRLYASGYTIGLLLTDVPDDPAALLEKANAALCAVIHAKTRLVCVAAGADSLSDAQREAVIAAGFRLWDPNITPTAGTAGTAAAFLRSARRQLSRTSRTTVVRLPADAVTAEALPGLCRFLASGYSVLAMNEWDDPINAANEIR